MVILFGSLTVKSQIKLTLQVQNTLPADVNDWPANPASVLLTAQYPPTIQVREAKLVITIRSGPGGIVCGNTPATAPPQSMSPTKLFKAADIVGLLSNCHTLPGGSYELCAQFFNIDNRQISEEICRPFTVADTKSNSRITLLAPADGATISEKDIRKPIQFRWTTIPPPKATEEALYKLLVYEVSGNQSATQTVRGGGNLVLEKNVTRETQTIWLLPPGSGGKKYAWMVQRVNKQGQGVGENNGFSEPWAFAVNEYKIQLDSIRLQCTATPGVYNFSYTITNANPGAAKLSNFAITSSTPGGATLSSFTPPLGTNIGPSAQLTITGVINASVSLSNICIGAEITDQVNTFWKASKDTCKIVDPCKCTVCDSLKITIPSDVQIKNDANGNIILPTTITVNPKKVRSIKAELVYYEYKPENDDCMLCNKDSKTFGNFISAQSGNQNLPIPYGHTAIWSSPIQGGQMITNLPLSFTISIPPTVKCCGLEVKWCIRYVITLEDCTVCNKLVCYTYNRKGCAN